MSRQLSYLLRHGAVKEGLTIDKEGYIPVDEIFDFMSKNGSAVKNLRQLREITDKDEKQRFTLIERDNVWYMRANQGHSIATVNEEALTEITDPNQCPVAVHGTFRKTLPAILATGLSKMARNHIHFAPGVTASSGIRKNCNVLIYANLPMAMADGIKFYVSDNGVILTHGNENGFLESKYFKSVVDITGHDLLAKQTVSINHETSFGGQRSNKRVNLPQSSSSSSARQSSKVKNQKQGGNLPRCAGCIVFRKVRDELQVCLISTHSGIYGFPKGKMDSGETHLECARREVREETGITSDQLEPLEENKYVDEAVRSSVDNTGKPSIRLFVTRLIPESVKLAPEDVDEIATCEFVSIEDAMKVLMPKRQIVLKQAMALL